MIDTGLAVRNIDFLMKSDVPPWRLISSRELAKLLGVSLQSLANWRLRGKGPVAEPPVKGRGNRIYYQRAQVLSWLSRFTESPRGSWEFSSDWLSAAGLPQPVPSEELTDYLVSLFPQRT
jgi:hypothetical protein